MKCLLVVALAILQVIAGEDSPCGNGWHHYEPENKCIRTFDKESRSWPGAEGFCEKEGGRILTIHNKGMHAFVTKTLQNDKTQYWIGLSQTQINKQYVWQDGTKLSGFNAWAKGEPNNQRNLENCVEMYGDGFWNDSHCWDSHSFICEKEGPGCQYNNGGCSFDAFCADPADGNWEVTCRCHHGYALQDGHCYDINECSFDLGGCDDICTNNDGSFACSCSEGYTAVGKTCTQDTIIG